MVMQMNSPFFGTRYLKGPDPKVLPQVRVTALTGSENGHLDPLLDSSLKTETAKPGFVFYH